MNRNADRAALVGDRAGDGLPDPPGSISGEAETAAVIVFLYGFHQAEVAFLDQIEEGNAAPEIFFGNADHQAGIGLDQVVAGVAPVLDGLLEEDFFLFRGRTVQLVEPALGSGPALDTAGQHDFLFSIEQRDAGHLFEIQANGVDLVSRDCGFDPVFGDDRLKDIFEFLKFMPVFPDSLSNLLFMPVAAGRFGKLFGFGLFLFEDYLGHEMEAQTLHFMVAFGEMLHRSIELFIIKDERDRVCFR